MELSIEDLAWEGLSRDEVGLLSFDVFDTVLLREDVSELRRFWQIAQGVGRQFPGLDPRDLLVARLTATRASYRTSRIVEGYREGELVEIHEMVEALLSAPGLAQQSLEIELAYEADVLKPNPAARGLWNALGEPRCIAVSNMYMSVSQIERLLAANGIDYVERVFSSTESKKTKTDTKLLRYAAESVGAQEAGRLHIGDSFSSDFVPAKKLGWHALWWPLGKATMDARRADAVACVQELEESGVVLGSLATHYLEHP